MNSRSKRANTSPEKTAPLPVDFEQQESGDPKFQMLHGTHEAFARSLSGALSQFLQSDIQVRLSGIRLTTVADFLTTLPHPSCLITMRLRPRVERVLLFLECPMVLNLLDLLLGGTASSEPATRELTEIEWSLLEEISRVLVRPLGDAWQSIKPVEFVVESLGSDPSQSAYPYPAAAAHRIAFSVSVAGRSGAFELAVPCSFFDAAEAILELPEIEDVPLNDDLERNARLLGSAEVEIEVYLDGVQLSFKELLTLRDGQIVKFDHALSTPVVGSINGDVFFKGHVMSAGRKRAFQIEEVEPV